MEEHDLDYPHEVAWGRGPASGRDEEGAALKRYDITGQGKAGQMISHATHALSDLVNRYRPVSVEFSGLEPSRKKAYYHMMQRLAGTNIGGGEYAFLHEQGRGFRSRGGKWIDEPDYFHIVHKAAAGIPRYQGMQEIPAREKARAGE